jgi:hypothetical protein
VYLVSDEEERVERLVGAAASKMGAGFIPIYTWSCLGGLMRRDEVVHSSKDPVEGLAAYLETHDPAPLVFKDLHLLIEDNPPLIRRLKDCARVLRTSPKAIFFVSPRLVLPPELFSSFKVEDVPLPRADELSKLLDAVIDTQAAKETLRGSLTPELRAQLLVASAGFTANEAVDAFRKAVFQRRELDEGAVTAVVEEKQALVRKGGVLEFVSVDAGTWEIGGLHNLKKWLNERRRAFSGAAAAHGLTPPKGILVMGISGCGKSLCVKAIATYWKLPLLRLDMGKIYDGLAGPPEQAMRTAIRTAEAVAPCVLWIDEIEAGIANQKQKAAGGAESRVLAFFLTWMQEKTSPVFVGATANEVEVLPPEILRKGRFDELFYMGLPSKEERREILSIHMKKRKVDPAQFDMDYLADCSQGHNGAELEQAVVAAVFEAMSRNTDLTEHILANALRNVVPLSRTMKERIEKIEAWARDRAMKASLSSF